ncbi:MULTISPECIES: glycosyltransferase family 2 protein [unclassified Janthinobacterium]|uniref:glycosyltransferase family 2 protein n=1 Tax=unclassified Janthinobacterium TaxID=2610881 RepID=UPI001610C67D|nr:MULTISPECIES: glycosyltransferase family 2 protein [unclassified Janthinobacterium]MBB5608600.1 glycosyltransferase involved in cell wall biosynthesis [Janthinobacterium sp. S3T4]MBB5614121.1 glycosyltransferase involved in cell wall biosynthesis [Janthinobacterium sp. S3M3]
MKLSICIPTYNRSAYLKRFLEKLYAEIDKFSLQKQVEVIVSDNSSADDTPEIVQSFVKKGLIYSRNENNIGPDANFLKLFEMSTGEYIWLPGDDDLFADDFLPYLLQTAEKEKFDYFYLRTVGEPASPGRRSYVAVSNTELFSRTTIFTTFMTSQVIRSKLVKPYITEARKYLGGFMAYYFIFAKALEESKICLISDQKEIFMTVENTGGYSFYKVWGDAVFTSLYDTGFVNDRKLISRFRMDMFVILILSVTYNLRKGGSSNKFTAGNGEFNIRKFFGMGLYPLIFRVYEKAPLFPLGLLHFFIRGLNKSRRIFLKAVC